MTEEALAALLRETAERHHDAFEETDGFDPGWPDWYAAYLRRRLRGLGVRPPTESDLAGALRDADRSFRRARAPFDEWPAYYAVRMLPLTKG